MTIYRAVAVTDNDGEWIGGWLNSVKEARERALAWADRPETKLTYVEAGHIDEITHHSDVWTG